MEEGRDVVFDIRFTRGEIHGLPAAASALSGGGVDLVPLPVSETREGDTNIAPPSSIVDPGATVRSRFIGQAAIAAVRAAIGV